MADADDHKKAAQAVLARVYKMPPAITKNLQANTTHDAWYLVRNRIVPKPASAPDDAIR